MKFLPLNPACPSCGSRDLTYTCEPKCCFNHLCNGCNATFQLVTEKSGGELPAAARAGLPGAGPDDSLAPTTGCARCESLAVYELDPVVDAATHVCGACFALLTFAITDVAQN